MDAAVEVVQSALNDVHQSYCLLSCTQGRQFWLLSSEGRRVSPLTIPPLIAEKDNRPLPLTHELFSRLCLFGLLEDAGVTRETARKKEKQKKNKMTTVWVIMMFRDSSNTFMGHG